MVRLAAPRGAARPIAEPIVAELSRVCDPDAAFAASVRAIAPASSRGRGGTTGARALGTACMAAAFGGADALTDADVGAAAGEGALGGGGTIGFCGTATGPGPNGFTLAGIGSGFNCGADTD